VSAASHVQDLLALVQETGRILRRGTVSALLAALPMVVTAVITVGFVVGMIIFFLRRDDGLIHPPASPFYSTLLDVVGVCAVYTLGLTALQAGPLVAYGLVALGEEATVRRTLALAVRAVPRLALLYLLLFFGPPIVFTLLADLVLGGQRSSAVVATATAEVLAQATAIALVVWGNTRILLFAQVSVALRNATRRELPSSWSLGRGRFPLQLAATVVPIFVLIAAVRPSAYTSAFLQGSLVQQAIEVLAAIAGVNLFTFLRAALATE
jgi:hypothetical protein